MNPENFDKYFKARVNELNDVPIQGWDKESTWQRINSGRGIKNTGWVKYAAASTLTFIVKTYRSAASAPVKTKIISVVLAGLIVTSTIYLSNYNSSNDITDDTIAENTQNLNNEITDPVINKSDNLNIEDTKDKTGVNDANNSHKNIEKKKLTLNPGYKYNISKEERKSTEKDNTAFQDNKVASKTKKTDNKESIEKKITSAGRNNVPKQKKTYDVMEEYSRFVRDNNEKHHKILDFKVLLFNKNEYELTSDAIDELNKVIKTLQLFPDLDIEIIGHSDRHEKKYMQQSYSESRADVVKKYLLSQGIDKKRIRTYGKGTIAPKSREKDKESQILNRRVEVVVLNNK